MRLREDEADSLKKVAESLVKPGSLAAMCAYGSKVAGYARPDSDYDIIVVGHKFREGVRYRYLHSPVEVSALIVDEALLMDDARTSFLGEFVVGRFLNIYEPIVGAAYLRKVEVEYKRRVLVDSLVELSSDYGGFSGDLLIPFEYFLFDKLRKRGMLYPPALYSYIRTYTCGSAPENRAASVSGFREAASGLRAGGFIREEGDHIRIVPEKMKGDAFTKVSSLFSLTARGVTQYAVHGYAGRVGLSVVRREAASKLKRMQDRPRPPLELERPKSLLRLEEGIVLPDASTMNEQLAKVSGFASFKVKEKSLGEPYTTTKVLTLVDGQRERTFVVKNFSDVMSLKWALLGLWAVAARKFSMTPIARLEREYTASIQLRRSGVKTAKIVAVAPDERIIVKEFIDGPTLSSIVEGLFHGKGDGMEFVACYGAAMAKVHAAGFALGDAKASNVIVSGGELYLTDLEQTVRGGDPAWDVAEFVYYTAKLSSKEASMERVADSFLKAYAHAGDVSVIRKARALKYFRPFQPFMRPGMARMLREKLDAYA